MYQKREGRRKGRDEGEREKMNSPANYPQNTSCIVRRRPPSGSKSYQRLLDPKEKKITRPMAKQEESDGRPTPHRPTQPIPGYNAKRTSNRLNPNPKTKMTSLSLSLLRFPPSLYPRPKSPHHLPTTHPPSTSPAPPPPTSAQAAPYNLSTNYTPHATTPTLSCETYPSAT